MEWNTEWNGIRNGIRPFKINIKVLVIIHINNYYTFRNNDRQCGLGVPTSLP